MTAHIVGAVQELVGVTSMQQVISSSVDTAAGHTDYPEDVAASRALLYIISLMNLRNR